MAVWTSGCGRLTEHQNSPEISGALVTRISFPEKLTAGGEMKLTMQLENSTSNEYKFLKWNSPFENTFLGDYLNIIDEKGEKVEYRGPMAKRMWPPPAEAYMTVSAGKMVESSIDISSAYPIAQPGKYIIQFEGMNGADSIPTSNRFEFIVE